jgi:hypothetical protein
MVESHGASIARSGRFWVAAVLVISVLVGATGCVRSKDAPDEPTAAVGTAAAEALVSAWRRSELGTFVVRSRFQRTVPDRSGLRSTAVLAQRPPERYSQRLGSVEARTADRQLSCSTGPDEHVACVDAGPALPYEEEVDRVVATLAGLVRGADRLYKVERRERGCFHLELVAERRAPPYGTAATLCFDPETGAPVRTEIVRPEGRDLTVAVEIRRRVTDADVRPPDTVAAS